jgi:poly(A) polymerase
MIFPFKTKYPVVLPKNRHIMFPAHIEGSVADIMNRLRQFGYQAYLVGGCVRDTLLEKNPKDFDVATNARPQQIKRLFRRCYLIGRRFRLAHVYISHDRFVEVATFRGVALPDQTASGRFAANNVYGTIEEDALRRDFTVNALYYNSADGSIVDYCGGLKDLKKKLVRSIGNPAKRFEEDPVRIIRAARFCAQLGFKLSHNDFKSALACAAHIKEANAHRMLEELYKILRCGASADTFRNLKSYGIVEHWLPELDSEDILEPLCKRLSAADRRRMQGKDVSNAVFITCLLFGLFSAAIGKAGDRTGFQEIFVLLNSQFRDLAVRLCLPRREWDAVCTIAARHGTFNRVNGGKKWKSFERRFVRNAHFPDALAFFEILSEATGKFSNELKYWQHRAAAASSHVEGEGRSRAADEPARVKKAPAR